MPYEVEKRVAGRTYRYRVESYRDLETGKPRAKWTYLGRGKQAAETDPEPAGESRKRTASATRSRLLAALERLLETREYADLTADGVAREAGVAHGTFYRHFADKRAALMAALEPVRSWLDALRAQFGGALGSRSDERRRLTAYVEAVLRFRSDRPALHRAWLAITEQNPQLMAERERKRATVVLELGAYIERLVEAGYAQLDSPTGAAWSILALIEGAFRVLPFEGSERSSELIRAARTAVDRAVFCPKEPLA